MSKNPIATATDTTPATASAHRDYGATSSSSAAIMPEVNFSPTEFMSLSENIANNINSIKSSWMQLEKALKVFDGKRGTPALRDKVHKIQEQTNTKIQTTTKDFQKLTALVRYGEKAQKLQLDKLTSDFKSVIEKYTECQKKIAVKIKQMYLQESVQINNESGQQNMSEEDRQILIQTQRQTQQSLMFEQDMLIDRESRIREVEAVVLDVNSIMKDLGTLVNQQGEHIDTIESSIENTAVEIEAGNVELRKAAEYKAKYRRKILILLVIAVIIGLIVTGIIVSKLKN